MATRLETRSASQSRWPAAQKQRYGGSGIIGRIIQIHQWQKATSSSDGGRLRKLAGRFIYGNTAQTILHPVTMLTKHIERFFQSALRRGLTFWVGNFAATNYFLRISRLRSALSKRGDGEQKEAVFCPRRQSIHLYGAPEIFITLKRKFITLVVLRHQRARGKKGNNVSN